MKKAYYSQDRKGKMNEMWTREGQKHLQSANELIKQNLPEIVKRFDPCAFTQAALAAGVSVETVQQCLKIINAARSGAAVETSAAIVAGGANLALLGEAMMITGGAVLGVIAVIGLAYLVCKFWDWLNSPKKNPNPVKAHYENQINSKPVQNYKPFQTPIRPGNI